MKYVILIGVLCVSLLSACVDKPQKLLAVNLKHQANLATCQASWANGTHSWSISQIQLYMSQFEVMNNNGQWQKISLADNAFQAQNVALISMICGQTAESNLQLSFTSPINDAVNLRFSLGVPFELNHLNPLSQPSPLNVPSMFWVWQTGHKFARIELDNNEDGWLFHLGSTGCSSASALRAPQQPCRQPNLFTLEVPINDAQVDIDLARWFDGVVFEEMPNCKSQSDNPSCHIILNNLLNMSQKTGH